jgi:hypothetical protein
VVRFAGAGRLNVAPEDPSSCVVVTAVQPPLTRCSSSSESPGLPPATDADTEYDAPFGTTDAVTLGTTTTRTPALRTLLKVASRSVADASSGGVDRTVEPSDPVRPTATWVLDAAPATRSISQIRRFTTGAPAAVARCPTTATVPPAATLVVDTVIVIDPATTGVGVGGTVGVGVGVGVDVGVGVGLGLGLADDAVGVGVGWALFLPLAN